MLAYGNIAVSITAPVLLLVNVQEKVETIKKPKKFTSVVHKNISLFSGVHAIFLSLIRMNRYHHFPVFHNQRRAISQKHSPSNVKHRTKQKEYLFSTDWFGYICCICHTHDFFNICQNVLYCNLDANLQGRRQWEKGTKK